MLRFGDASVNSNILKSLAADFLMETPYALESDDNYRRWRDRKLQRYPRHAADLLVETADLPDLSAAERRRLGDTVARGNMALLQCTKRVNINKESLSRLGVQIGLRRLDANPCADEDAISTLTVSDQGRGHEYIPYTNRALSWHTDGYYNAPGHQVRAWALLCAQDAEDGGENELLDPEILYILLREENPDYIRALMAPDALTIPANVENGRQIRPARSGPVFSVDAADGSLHMRYSARGRNIVWKPDPLLEAARRFIETLFSSGSPYIFRHRLAPGQCLVSNNVLHNRSAFRDATGRPRVVYRARYYDRIRCP